MNTLMSGMGVPCTGTPISPYREFMYSANQNLRYNNHIANTAIEGIKNTMFEPNIVFLWNSLFEKL